MNRPALALAACLSLACAANAADAPKSVHVEVKNAGGGGIGHAVLTEAPGGVLLRLELKNLTPGWHGLHFHETGDCSKSDFTSAGAHVHAKPSVVHGLLNPDSTDSGDLPNLFASADGSATAELFSTYVSITGAGGRPALSDADGSALVVHANPDDYASQPIGGAGARIACGVIAKAG